jgi:TPR repeat protein
LKIAAELYKKAAKQRDADGANNHSLCLEDGKGVPKRPLQAARYYKIASDLGHTDGANNYRWLEFTQ